MPSLSGTRRRHQGKQPSQTKKAAPPEPLSIVSNDSPELSTAANTPRNIFHSSLRPSKRPGLTVVGRAERSSSGSGLPKTKGVLEKESVDVFAFMEHEDKDDSGTEASDEPSSETSPPSSPNSLSETPRMIEMPQKSPRYSDLEVRVQNAAPRAWRQDSLHSDSGISVRSHSSDQDSPAMKDKFPLDHETPRIGIAGCEHNDNSEPNGLQISPNLETNDTCFTRYHWPSLDMGGPEAYQASSPQRPKQQVQNNDMDCIPEMQARSASSLVHFELRRQRGSRSAGSPSLKSGYDHLASNIDSRDDAFLTPIYRKFEILNNRMLLYLQDEIAQMEEDLKELDTAIATEDAGHGKRGPASRRSEAKLPSQLQWHRMDLMGRTFAKVEQYSKSIQLIYVETYKTLRNELTMGNRPRLDLVQQPHQKPRARLPRRHHHLPPMDRPTYPNRRAGSPLPRQRSRPPLRHPAPIHF